MSKDRTSTTPPLRPVSSQVCWAYQGGLAPTKLRVGRRTQDCTGPYNNSLPARARNAAAGRERERMTGTTGTGGNDKKRGAARLPAAPPQNLEPGSWNRPSGRTRRALVVVDRPE